MRDKWTSRLGFILAATGSAVGLGNIWKFPYTLGTNGGGAFMIIYIFFLITIGLPLMLSAISFGRYTQKSVFGAYKSIHKKWSFVGMMGIVCGFFILAFYSTVGGWVLYYLKSSVVGNLNTSNIEILNKFFIDYMNNTKLVIFYQTIFMLLTLLVVIKGISKGIEKASKIMMPTLFILLLILAVKSLSLKGSLVGIKFLFIPDFKKINMGIIMNALGQVFFTLSIGMGVMITYGSYLSKDQKILSTAFLIPFFDTLVALISAIAIIPAVFVFGFEISEGPGLMFKTLPAVFNSMLFGQLFLVLFFILVTFAALTSSISMLQIASSYFIEEKNFDSKKTIVIIALIILLIGIPASISLSERGLEILKGVNVFNIYDKLTSNILLPTGGFLLSIFIGWILKPYVLINDIERNGEVFKFKFIWTFLIKYIVPIGVFIVLINSYIDFIKSF